MGGLKTKIDISPFPFKNSDIIIVLKLHEQSIISAVALTEGYLMTVLKMVLTWHPDRLGRSVTDVKFEKRIDLEMILELLKSRDIDLLLSNIIDKRLFSVFYDSPDNLGMLMHVTPHHA
jgi:hypothetical protein